MALGVIIHGVDCTATNISGAIAIVSELRPVKAELPSASSIQGACLRASASEIKNGRCIDVSVEDRYEHLIGIPCAYTATRTQCHREYASPVRTGPVCG